MADSMLQPGLQIRPQMTESQARDLVEQLYGLKVLKIKEMISYDDRNYHVKVSEKHSNPHIKDLWPHGFILKVLNSMDSQKKHVEAEHEAQHILLSKGFNVPCPVPNLQGKEFQLERIYYQYDDEPNQNNNIKTEKCYGDHLVRLMSFLPGIIFVEVPYRPELLFQVGRYIGSLENTLKGFSHPALLSHKTMWALSSVPKLDQFLYAVTDEENQHVVKKVLKAFNEEVVPKSAVLEKGVIHGDYNEQNIVVHPKPGFEDKPDSEKLYDIYGVIDFGDMQETCYVYELAIAIMYMMVESHVVDPLDVGGHVLAGYLQERSLDETEYDVLKVCVAGRFIQSLVMGAYTLSQDPGNEYAVVTAANGWTRLKRLWNTPKETLYDRWRDIVKSYQS